ncbi:MAG: class I SAM-dependent methyltransferase [Patescibacteria group bacterium]|nr:class I SAM-dependent methyltransferase [Patescibacteria group bacterium]
MTVSVSPENFESSPELYRLGEVTENRVIQPQEFGIAEPHAPLKIIETIVSDPYVEEYNFIDAAEVKQIESDVSLAAQERRLQGLWERKQGTVYFDENGVEQEKKGWGDPVSRDNFFNKILKSPAINAWRSKIPSANALADLSDPQTKTEVTDNRGNIVDMDETAHKWLTLCTDAVAIRSRGSIMANVVKQFIDEQKLATDSDEGQSLKWMSIACGTALPAMKAALHAGIQPQMLLVDLDSKALQATRDLADEIGFEGAMSQRSDVNIFVPAEMAKLRDELGSNGDRPMLIDLMGIFEYTGNNLGVDPVHFLRSVYDMLHPGGRLVFGQMRDDRPVADFTMGVVSWPYVEMRSPKEFMEIIEAAGIPVKATTLYLPTDNVYTVGVIDKPLDNESFSVPA